jgi:hypothetical protein
MPSPAPSHDTTPASLRACVQWRGLPLPHAMSRPELSWPQGMPPPAPKPGAQPKACHCVVRPSPPNLRHAATRPSCLLTPLWEGEGRGVGRWHRGVGRGARAPVCASSSLLRAAAAVGARSPLVGPGADRPRYFSVTPLWAIAARFVRVAARGGHAGPYILIMFWVASRRLKRHRFAATVATRGAATLAPRARHRAVTSRVPVRARV